MPIVPLFLSHMELHFLKFSEQKVALLLIQLLSNGTFNYWLLAICMFEVGNYSEPGATRAQSLVPQKTWEKLQHATFADDDHFTNGMQPFIIYHWLSFITGLSFIITLFLSYNFLTRW